MPLQAPLASSYDYRLVALSVLITIHASYAALDLGRRVAVARGHPPRDLRRLSRDLSEQSPQHAVSPSISSRVRHLSVAFAVWQLANAGRAIGQLATRS